MNLTTGANYVAKSRMPGCDEAAAKKIEAANNAKRLTQAAQAQASLSPACKRWAEVLGDPNYTKDTTNNTASIKGLNSADYLKNQIIFDRFDARNNVQYVKDPGNCALATDLSGKVISAAAAVKAGVPTASESSACKQWLAVLKDNRYEKYAAGKARVYIPEADWPTGKWQWYWQQGVRDILDTVVGNKDGHKSGYMYVRDPGNCGLVKTTDGTYAAATAVVAAGGTYDPVTKTYTVPVDAKAQAARSASAECKQWQAVFNDKTWTKEADTRWGGEGWAAKKKFSDAEWEGWNQKTGAAFAAYNATSAIWLKNADSSVMVKPPVGTCYQTIDSSGGGSVLKSKDELAKEGKTFYDPLIGQMVTGDPEIDRAAINKRIAYKNAQMNKGQICDTITADVNCPGGWRPMTKKEKDDWWWKNNKVKDQAAPVYTEAEAKAACAKPVPSGRGTRPRTKDETAKCVEAKLKETKKVTRDLTAAEKQALLELQQLEAFGATDNGKSDALKTQMENSMNNVKLQREYVWDANLVLDPKKPNEKGGYRPRTAAEKKEFLDREAWTSTREYGPDGKERIKSDETKAYEAQLAKSAYNPIDKTWHTLEPTRFDKTQVDAVQTAIKNCHYKDKDGFFEWCGGGQFGLIDPRYTDKCCGWGANDDDRNAHIKCDWKTKPVASRGAKKFVQCADERNGGQIFQEVDDHKVNVKWPDGTPYGTMSNDSAARIALDIASQVLNPAKAIANRARSNGQPGLAKVFDIGGMFVGGIGSGLVKAGQQLQSGETSGATAAFSFLGAAFDPSYAAQQTLKDYGYTKLADAMGYGSMVATTFIPGMGPELLMAKAALRAAAAAVTKGGGKFGANLLKSGVWSKTNVGSVVASQGGSQALGVGVQEGSKDRTKSTEVDIYYDEDGNPTIDKPAGTEKVRKEQAKVAAVAKLNAQAEYDAWMALPKSKRDECQPPECLPPPKP